MKLLPYQQAILDGAAETLDLTLADVLSNLAENQRQALTMAITGTITAALQVGLERALQHNHSVNIDLRFNRISCGSGTPIDQLPGGDPAGGETSEGESNG